MGLHRQALLRGRFQHGHIPNANHGYVQRSRNRGGGQSQHIHLILHVFDDFLVANAKALLFIHNEQAQIFELHILGQQPMGAHHNVNLPILQPLQHILLFLGRAEATDHLRRYREAMETLYHRVVVLLHQNGGRCQNGDLLTIHHSFEGGTETYFRFAVTHIAAQQAIHVPVRFHIMGDFLDTLLLVRGQFIGELIFKFPLPRCIRAEGVSFMLASLGIQFHQVEGQLFQSFLHLALLLLPLAATKVVQLWWLVGIADIPLHPFQLLHRHIQFIISLILNQQIISESALTLQPDRTLIDTHAVIFMHNVVAHLQIREGSNLFPGAPAGLGLPIPGTVNVRIGNEHQFGVRPDKTVAKGHGQNQGFPKNQVMALLHKGSRRIQFLQGLGQPLASCHATGKEHDTIALFAPPFAVCCQGLHLSLIAGDPLAAQVKHILGDYASHAPQKFRHSRQCFGREHRQHFFPVHEQLFLLLHGFSPLHGTVKILIEAIDALLGSIPQLIRLPKEHHVRIVPIQQRIPGIGEHR